MIPATCWMIAGSENMTIWFTDVCIPLAVAETPDNIESVEGFFTLDVEAPLMDAAGP